MSPSGGKHWPRRGRGTGSTTPRRVLLLAVSRYCCRPFGASPCHVLFFCTYLSVCLSYSRLPALQMNSHLYKTDGALVGAYQRIDIPILREFEQYNYVLFTGG